MPHCKMTLHAILCAATLALVVGCSPAAQAPAVPPFHGDRAFDLLQKQVDLGPRVPGAPGHAAGAKLIESQLKPYADSVTAQDFTRQVDGKTVEMSNIIARFNSGARRWVLLAAHWDTRPMADYEVDAAKRKLPIPGANDGASGVAVLLELARVFSVRKPDVGVLMVFFDGEDYGATESGMYLGSKYFARNLKESTAVDGKPVKIDYGILLDMVGDKNLDIHQERGSVESAPEVVEKVWSVAKDLGYQDIFLPDTRYTIVDDHIPLIRAGIKCVDIIDFDYSSWHTLADTPDKCSPKSLKTVGEVVAHVIYEEKPS